MVCFEFGVLNLGTTTFDQSETIGRKRIFANHLKPGFSKPGGQKQWDPRSAFQIPRPQVYSSNTETLGLQHKYWDPRSTFQLLRPWVCNSNIEVLLVQRFCPNWKQLKSEKKSESETLEVFLRLSWQLAVKVKGSTYCFYDEKFRNQQWKCELWPHHTQDGQHGYACQHPAAAVREIWGELDLIFTFSGMQVTTIEIPFCSPFFQLSRPH